MIYVVGSGPAGISAAGTLVAAGLPVTLIDGGIALEPQKQAELDKLSARPKAEWDRALLDSWKSKVVSDKKGVQIEYAYGSDYPYRTGADTVKGLTEFGFSAADLQAIGRNNAVRLMPRLANPQSV